LRPFIILGVGFFFLFMLSIGIGAYAGLRQGEREREQRLKATAEHHYQQGIERLENGEYERAIAEFEYVLEVDPDHPLAEQGIDEAQTRHNSQPTPTTESQEVMVEEIYREAVEAYEDEQWQSAAADLVQLRALNPDYKPEEVEQMLFESRYEAGMALLEEDRFEEGIFYLDQAVALRPLDEEARQQRNLAMKYMTALGYWGVDWGRCIDRFEEIYASAPDYKDVFQRLYRARLRYAEAWYAEGEMCPAEEQYAEALRLVASSEVESKRAEAAEICEEATPTPVSTIEGSETITMTDLPEGFNVGRLAYPVYNAQTGLYDVYALFAEGRLVKMAAGADQPCWVWGTRALGYRNLTVGGISLLPAGATDAQLLASGAGLTWPTFSPDGKQMAYAAQDGEGSWQIYIAPTDGSADPTLHASGKGPTWGPTGFLAWTGCDDEGTCGIIVDNPDDDQSPKRLSSNYSDIGLHWSPDGGNLAYMSNHTGNWEIYLASLAGGFAQLTDNPANDGLPAWAPDGSGLAFASDRDGEWALYVMQPNGENPRKIMALGSTFPNWTNQRVCWAP
jgi:tetratricopeptide (TPR) repeat protein